MSESLSDAVREAAMVEADRKVAAVREECGWASDDAAWYRHGFAQGAVWVAGRLPGRDEIAAMFTSRREPEYQIPEQEDFDDADAVLALIREHVTKEAT